MIRQPAVAGQFYDADPARLKAEILCYVGPSPSNEPAVAVVAPHAGYLYSGAVAGAAYARAAVPETVVVLGPNHTGLGAPAAVMDRGTWTTPLGRVAVAGDLADLLLAATDLLQRDTTAHVYEHSLEVQVPFLQVRQPALEIVPICLSHLPYPACREIGEAVAAA
ncbi:AmmeMemoRadiSam system protein B, partial [Dissulfurirhabdus thermomarina]